MALQSTIELNQNQYELALLLATEAHSVSNTLDASRAFYDTMTHPWHTRYVLYGHTGAVTQATWSQDESKVLTSSADNTARIWDAASGQQLVLLAGHTGAVNQATWSQDEGKVLTSGYDKTVRIWDVPIRDLGIAICLRLVRNMSWEEWQRLMENSYRPTCTQAPLPLSVIEQLRTQANVSIQAGDQDGATSILDQLNEWLTASGQYNIFGSETMP